MRIWGALDWIAGGQGIILLAAAMALPVYGQADGGAGSAFPDLYASTVLHSGQLVREIDDPSTGARWLLFRDASHPGGPGRLIQVANLAAPGREQPGLEQSGLEQTDASAAVLLGAVSRRPVIRAGDRLIVEEHTAVVEAWLEAVALGPAAMGSTLEVRLKVGGKVMRAMALGPGRATLQTELRPTDSEARP